MKKGSFFFIAEKNSFGTALFYNFDPPNVYCCGDGLKENKST